MLHFVVKLSERQSCFYNIFLFLSSKVGKQAVNACRVDGGRDERSELLSKNCLERLVVLGDVWEDSFYKVGVLLVLCLHWSVSFLLVLFGRDLLLKLGNLVVIN